MARRVGDVLGAEPVADVRPAVDDRGGLGEQAGGVLGGAVGRHGATVRAWGPGSGAGGAGFPPAGFVLPRCVVGNGRGVTVRHEGSLVRRRVLARELRQLREQAGLTLEQAAPRLHFSVSKLSRIETAQIVIDPHWVKSMLDLYDIGGDRWTDLTDLAVEALQPGWWKAFGIGNDSYLAYETEATRAQMFTLGFVPGLFQTAEYARALMDAVPLRRTTEELDAAVAARMYRKRRLTSQDHPLQVVAVIDERALRQPVGGAAVLKAQLRQIADLADLDTVVMRVLPTAVGAHASLTSSFTILNFGDLGEPDIVSAEHVLGAVMLDKSGDVARARLVFERLLADALDPAASLDTLLRYAEQP